MGDQLICSSVYYEANPVCLCGINTIAQVDDSKLNHNGKSHMGTTTEILDWAITMVDTTMQKLF